MSFALIVIIAAGAAGILAWAAWRIRGWLVEDTGWAFLASRVPWDDETAAPDELEALPAAARRFFAAVLAEGRVSRTVFEAFVAVEQGFRFGRTAQDAGIQVHQIVAAPHGAVWKAVGPRGFAASVGFTPARAWVRRRVFGLAPYRLSLPEGGLCRQMLLEAALWAPASLLRKAAGRWEGDEEAAVRSVFCDGGDHVVRLRVDPDGRLEEVKVTSLGDGEEGWLSARVLAHARYGASLLPARVSLQYGDRPAGCELRLLEHRFPEVWSSERRG